MVVHDKSDDLRPIEEIASSALKRHRATILRGRRVRER